MPEESYEDVVYESEVQEEGNEEVSESDELETEISSSTESDVVETESELETETDPIDYDLLLQKLYERSVSDNDMTEEETTTTEEETTTEELEICTDLDEFETSTVQVDLYQYTILNRLEFMQYAICIVIALLFLIIFMRYKKK